LPRAVRQIWYRKLQQPALARGVCVLLKRAIRSSCLGMIHTHASVSTPHSETVPLEAGLCAHRCRAPWRLHSRSGRPVRVLRRRPWSMPITARANREAGDAEAGAAASGNSTKATVSHPKASARLAAHGASATASWWAEAPHHRSSGLNASAISSSQNRMWLQQHHPQLTTLRTADGPRTAQIASHGRLTACRSRLMRYPDRSG